MSGLELQQKLMEMRVDIPIILITGHADVQMAVTAMRRGAFDFIEKPFQDNVLLDSIRGAIAANSQSQQLNGEDEMLAEKWGSLTPREKQVAALVVSGKPNKVSAYELGVSQRTVEIHRARVMRKTGAESLADLVRISLLVDK
jgi:FixJ family two-component response regulator